MYIKFENNQVETESSGLIIRWMRFHFSAARPHSWLILGYLTSLSLILKSRQKEPHAVILLSIKWYPDVEFLTQNMHSKHFNKY